MVGRHGYGYGASDLTHFRKVAHATTNLARTGCRSARTARCSLWPWWRRPGDDAAPSLGQRRGRRRRVRSGPVRRRRRGDRRADGRSTRHPRTRPRRLPQLGRSLLPGRSLPALAAAVLALGAAACGHGGDGPVTTPPPALGSDASDGGGSDPDPSDGGGAETEEPTAAAPDIPAPDPADYPGMDEETPEGAEQALRYYIAVVYWGYQTGDTETLEGLHQNSCETCLGFGDEISELGQAGSYWKTVTLSDFGIKHYDS